MKLKLNAILKQDMYRLTVNCMLLALLFSCSQKKQEMKEEQITVSPSVNVHNSDSLINSIKGNLSFNHASIIPNSVILTGLPNSRLVSIYKSSIIQNNKSKTYNYSNSYYKRGYENGEDENEAKEHFMPGIDILYGYNLINIAHYDMKTEKLSYLFEQMVLIKTLYYPCFEQDSLNGKPINRNYYLVSVYDEDTNKDSLINKKDLRRFYYFSENNSQKIRLIPNEYSVIRSQYDSKNDIMYVFTQQDLNKNGRLEIEEPVKIFWIGLKNPQIAKVLY